MSIVEKSITDFLSNEYKEFAMYSIEGRAIPSVIDSFKVSQRKIIHISNKIWKTGKEKTIKVFQLCGKVSSDAFYHHGDASLSNAIVVIAQRFKNNAPLLEEDGQFGSLRTPQAGAPRYIGTKLSDNFRLSYKDFDLLTYKEEEGEIIEPEFFLPIIPMILINGSSGIAVGFSSNILNRDVKEVIKSVVDVLNGKKIKELKPYSPYFKGEFIQDENNNKRWISRGIYTKQGSTSIRITELPMSITYEKYEVILDKLVEDREILSYVDNCKDNIDYTIKFRRGVLETLTESQITKMFKLEEYNTEIFTTLDENNKLKIFESTVEIIEYFVNFRLKYYHKRKELLLSKIKSELKILSNRGKFIKYILDDKLKVNNVKKDVIISNVEKLGLDKNNGGYDYLLKMPIYSLTNELYEKLKQDFTYKREEQKRISDIDPKDMYLEDLKEIKNNFKYE